MGFEQGGDLDSISRVSCSFESALVGNDELVLELSLLVSRQEYEGGPNRQFALMRCSARPVP